MGFKRNLFAVDPDPILGTPGAWWEYTFDGIIVHCRVLVDLMAALTSLVILLRSLLDKVFQPVDSLLRSINIHATLKVIEITHFSPFLHLM